MTARAQSRGWPIHWNGSVWIYTDTGEPPRDARPCRRCGEEPTPEGHDACLGSLPGVESACCGHGVEAPYRQIVDSLTTAGLAAGKIYAKTGGLAP